MKPKLTDEESFEFMEKYMKVGECIDEDELIRRKKR